MRSPALQAPRPRPRLYLRLPGFVSPLASTSTLNADSVSGAPMPLISLYRLYASQQPCRADQPKLLTLWQVALTWFAPCPMPRTGLPAENDTVHCPQGSQSCYFMYFTSRTYSQASALCAKNTGARLVSWNSGMWTCMPYTSCNPLVALVLA